MEESLRGSLPSLAGFRKTIPSRFDPHAAAPDREVPGNALHSKLSGLAEILLRSPGTLGGRFAVLRHIVFTTRRLGSFFGGLHYQCPLRLSSRSLAMFAGRIFHVLSEPCLRIKKRMDLCWLEITEAELRAAHLAELSAIYEELLEILDQYGMEAVPHA